METASATNGGSDPLGLDPKSTVLAKDDSLSGKLHLTGPGRVLGHFTGRIECSGDLFVGPEAHVEADIEADRVTVAGLVRGNVTAMSRLKITTSGRLEGDAVVGALIVQEGGVHRGVIKVHPEGVPQPADERSGHSVAVQPVVVPLKTVANPVGRVRKFWGEFF
ncbi:MAG TPA: polymer-forming cytoskeletal protein [Candidatus Dormibacteraeota bacterium]|nr:polymer-forming cytoskeletal protein [Candidatus Dormibacteraeota bacterium]